MSIAAAQWDEARSLRLAMRLRGMDPTRIGGQGMVREGVLRRAVGLTLEATGCEAPLGARCSVESSGGRWVDAEVVGFAGDRTFLMPTSDLSGLLPNARVITGSSMADQAVESALRSSAMGISRGSYFAGLGSFGGSSITPTDSMFEAPMSSTNRIRSLAR